MANRLNFTVPAGPTSTGGLTQISLGTFDLTAIPGFGSLAAVTRWSAQMRSRVAALHQGGDHGSRSWELVAACLFNSSGGFSLLATPISGNINAAGEVIAAGSSSRPGAAFVWDNVSDVVRFRVTPTQTNSTVWMASHDVEILIP